MYQHFIAKESFWVVKMPNRLSGLRRAEQCLKLESCPSAFLAVSPCAVLLALLECCSESTEKKNSQSAPMNCPPP